MRRATVKQNRFIKEYVTNGGNATQAALVTYETRNYSTAKAIGSENLTKPYIRREIDRLMKRENLSVTEALVTVREALDAKDAKGKPNHRIRLKAADMIFKLSDAYPKTTAAANPHQNSTYHSSSLTEVMDRVREEPAAIRRYVVIHGTLPSAAERERILEECEST